MYANRPILYLLLLLGLSGCLPSSCNRIESRALFPADSLSRQMAAQLPVDTLRLQWEAVGSETAAMQHPRTVRFGAEGRIYVGDTERNSVFAFAADGTFLEEMTDEGFSFPYLAGTRGDTVLVFNPEAHRIDFVTGGTVARSLPTPADIPKRGRLQYVTVSETAIYFKALAQDFEGYLARLDAQGQIAERHALPGPYWRYAGLLRLWGDSLLSLSGFRPLIDVLPPGGRLDSLTLLGFDSPMLARSRRFLLGKTHQPPLLTASAAPAGDLLFVLNMRPGWLRIDTYDRAGRLQHILTQENPAFGQEFFPTDLAVRRTSDGAYEIALITTKPTPRLALYRWFVERGA